MLSYSRAWRSGLWRQCNSTLRRRSFSKTAYPEVSKQQVCNNDDDPEHIRLFVLCVVLMTLLECVVQTFLSKLLV